MYIKKINKEFDIIFADPPYNLEDTKYFTMINEIFKKNCLKSEWIFNYRTFIKKGL